MHARPSAFCTFHSFMATTTESKPLKFIADFLSATRTQDSLVTDFFLVFSRFEYALKRAGYIVPGTEHAKPDWKRFASDAATTFDERFCPQLDSAVSYLKVDPPKQQIVSSGLLAWRKIPERDGELWLGVILRWVRAVRNNLFHGGKFPLPIGPIAEPTRNHFLLHCSLIILDDMLRISLQVREHFLTPLE